MRNCRPVSGHSNAPSTISTSIKTWCKFFKNSSSSPDLWFSVNSLGSVLASPSYRFCGRKMEIFIKQILVFLQLKQKKKSSKLWNIVNLIECDVVLPLWRLEWSLAIPIVAWSWLWILDWIHFPPPFAGQSIETIRNKHNDISNGNIDALQSQLLNSYCTQ